MSWIQARMPSAWVVGSTNTGVSGFRHSAHCRHWPPSASVRVWKDMRRSTHIQQFQRQKFLCCRSSCVERLATTSGTGHELQTFQAVTEGTQCLSCRRPRRTVTVVFVCFKSSLTYLLTYLLRPRVTQPNMTARVGLCVAGPDVVGRPKWSDSRQVIWNKKKE